jgi:hypothetical protein
VSDVRALIMRSSLGENVCPECKAGKHPNCTGQALDADTDTFVPCVCGNLGHP